MAKQLWISLASSKLVRPLMVLFAVGDAVGLYVVLWRDGPNVAATPRRVAAPVPPAPVKPLPPAMITPPSVADALQSGTLIVISKKSQHMYVFSDGLLWANTPVSTGKRRHETPSGVFPILQKRTFHRSNIYSGAPMPFMQRLTWSGIALHAGYVPGYAASHGCVRVPRAFAQSLFKLTKASATTVVIGDDPLESDVHAQQFALTAPLKVYSALAPPADPKPAAPPVAVAAAPPQPVPPPIMRAPQTTSGQTIQLTAAASQADAEAHWARLLKTRPDLSRFAKRVEPAVVNYRQVYRLRLSGADAYRYCLTLKNAGISCLNVS
jgi:L,D-transpeptidase catalytic domain/SPOR domain